MMDQTTACAGRAQHQQRRATMAIEESLQRLLRSAHAAGVHLDLEVIVATGMKLHMRVQAVDDGLLSGIKLEGSRFDLPRRCAGPTAVRASRVILFERIMEAGYNT